jgi:hypothetical protein
VAHAILAYAYVVSLQPVAVYETVARSAFKRFASTGSDARIPDSTNISLTSRPSHFTRPLMAAELVAKSVLMQSICDNSTLKMNGPTEGCLKLNSM